MIKKGMRVKVLAGKDKKKEGEVIEIDRKNNRAKIKGINIDAEVGRHMLYTTNTDTPGIIGILGKTMAEKTPVSVDASWPPQAGAKVEYELNGRWFPGCISMASPTTLYFRYVARCLKNEEPIERDDLSRLRPQRRPQRRRRPSRWWPRPCPPRSRAKPPTRAAKAKCSA